MFLPLFLFFLDIIFFILLDGWFVHLLLIFFIIKQVESANQISPSLFLNFYVFFLILEDLFLYGRVGMSLVSLVPIVLLATRFGKLFYLRNYIFGCFFLFLSFCAIFFIQKVVLGLKLGANSTIKIIFINLILMILAFKISKIWGMRGNRFLVKN